jgi:hypothetical protein
MDHLLRLITPSPRPPPSPEAADSIVHSVVTKLGESITSTFCNTSNEKQVVRRLNASGIESGEDAGGVVVATSRALRTPATLHPQRNVVSAGSSGADGDISSRSRRRKTAYLPTHDGDADEAESPRRGMNRKKQRPDSGKSNGRRRHY